MKIVHDAPIITTKALHFLKENVFQAAEMKKSGKLNEILERFKDNSENVFVMQHDKEKSLKAVLIDYTYFEKLLSCQELMDDSYNRKPKPVHKFEDEDDFLTFLDAQETWDSE
ncbi:hypothetical protein DFR57_101199 [Saliterribacillus persicus]|uniref:Antitoxin n=1 Tax=Saliterribacillus persicus TaxID=930114 RepID=A0A368YD15_9BACI|nr:hypothetical protein DFR57_101199 [Saliterribacillus persicus]